jgi:hypothetical protein
MSQNSQTTALAHSLLIMLRAQDLLLLIAIVDPMSTPDVASQEHTSSAWSLGSSAWKCMGLDAYLDGVSMQLN